MKKEQVPGRTRLKQHTLDGGLVSVAIFVENQAVAHVIGGKRGTVVKLRYDKGWVYTVQFRRQREPEEVIEALLAAAPQS